MKVFDYVRDTETNNEGVIIKLNKNTAHVSFSDKAVSLKSLKVIDRIELDTKDLIKIFRISDFNDVKYRAIFAFYPIKSNFSYKPTLYDLRNLLMNVKLFNITQEIITSWVYIVNFVLKDNYEEVGEPSDDKYDAYLLKNQRDVFDYVLQQITDVSNDPQTVISEEVDIDQLIKEVQNNIDCDDISKKEYGDMVKANFISEVSDCDELDKLDGQKRDLFKQFTLQLAQKGNLTGLEVLAYSYYGGNSVFECDWKKSQELLLQLYQKSASATYANSLGYIYYYGRTNNNVAQYDLAFKYFSIAAAYGNYEARYKLADMFSQGKEVVKNKYIASNIYDEIYKENLSLFQRGFYDCKLADVALRIASIELQKDNPDVYLALWYAIEAKKAIELRMEYFDFYGDKTVKESIEKVYNSAVELKEKRKEKLEMYFPGIIQPFYEDGQFVEIELKMLKSGKLKIKATQINRNPDVQYKRLIPIFDNNECILTDNITIYGCGNVSYSCKNDKLATTHMEKGEGAVLFYNCDEVVAEIWADYYQIHSRKNKKD